MSSEPSLTVRTRRTRTVFACCMSLFAAQLGDSSEVHASSAQLAPADEAAAGADDAAGHAGHAGQVGPGIGGAIRASLGHTTTDDGVENELDDGWNVDLARLPASSSFSTMSGARTAARAFWAVVLISLLFAHHHRAHRRRPRTLTPSRRFRL